MTLKNYTNLWFILGFIILVEYLALNFHPQLSVLNLIKHSSPHSKFWSQLNLSPEPGRQISLFLGWAGISLMVLMNVYTLKKRVKLFANVGPSVAKTFDFHIFCGLLGPTLIIFHCNLKVRGLVAISFWSMVVSAISGILGRYLYSQILSKKQDLLIANEENKIRLEQELIKVKPEIAPARTAAIMQQALYFVGVANSSATAKIPSLWGVLVGSIMGDLRLFFSEPGLEDKLNFQCRRLLTIWASGTKRALNIEPLQKIMGYWHAFHLPFAFFMYIAAVIHIFAALLFGVSK